MNKLFILLFFLPLWFGLSCKSTSQTPDAYEKKQIVFGNGGGFTGEVVSYYLQESGDLYTERSLKPGFNHLKKLPKKEVKSIFNQVEEMGLMTMDYKQTGNMTSFIEIKTPSNNNRITWEMDSPKLSEEMIRFYKQLMALPVITE